MTFMAWPEIALFNNIRKYTASHPEILNGQSVVQYKAKIKLHGTNSAIQIHADGTIVCQSRESIITPEKDNAGFARWVMSNKEQWFAAAPDGHIIYGEWIGPGIQRNVAVSEIPKKCFAVFASRPLGKDRMPIESAMCIGINGLELFVENIPDAYALPWYARPQMHGSDTNCDVSLNIDWSLSSEELTKQTEKINEWVAAIETNDPWVEATFGVKGTGEGLVFYPVSKEHSNWESFGNLCFKAKGEKHKNIATAKPAQVSAEAAASIDAFVNMVLTTARLEQGATKVALTPGSFNLQQTGKFVSWVLADVEKETQDELAASNLTWKEVQREVSNKARQWYLEQAKK